jgi:hypothetical protein
VTETDISQFPANDPANQVGGHDLRHDLAPVKASQFFLTDKLQIDRT